MSDNTKTNVQSEIEATQRRLQELQEQAYQEQQRERELQRKLEQEKAEKERVEKRKMAMEKWAPVADALVEALRKAGFKNACWQEPNDSYRTLPDFHPLGKDTYAGDLSIQMVAMGGSGYRRSHITGYKINVGSYGHIKGFPQKKDGTFNYDKIADELAQRQVSRLAEEQRIKERAQKVNSSKKIVTRLKDQYGYKSGADSAYVWMDSNISIEPSNYHTDKVAFQISHAISLTEEQATRLLDTMKELGLLPRAGQTGRS